MSITETQLWTALVTPMKENGALHLDDFSSLVHRQDEAGNGVLVLGSTGEGLALSDDDKKKIIKTATSLNIDVPVMAGVGGFNLKAQIAWLEYCHQYEVDSFLLVTPLYAKPGPRGQVEWFKSLLDAADKPCFIYNVPSRTGSELAPLVIEELRDHPNFVAVKEASGSISKYQEYAKIDDDIAFYSGDDGMMPFFAMAGCSGLISVASNVWPAATHRYMEWCMEGRGTELLPLWQECADALFNAPNPVPVKTLLHEKGWITTKRMRLPLTPEEIQDDSELINADHLIKNWYEKTS